MNNTEHSVTGYPSKDKPWLKYYTTEAINDVIPTGCIYDQLRLNSQKNMDLKAITYFSKKITYKKLLKNIDEVACSFAGLGVKKGDIVNVALPNIPENVYILYGLNKIGAIANFIDLRSKGDSLLHYFTETTAEVAVVCDIFADNVSEILDKTSIKSVVLVSPYDSLPIPARVMLKRKKIYKDNNKYITWKCFLKNKSMDCVSVGASEDIAVILHTSGTTGTPKGVMLTNHVFNAMANQVKDCGMVYKRGERFLNQVPPFLAYNVISALNDPLSLGLQVVLLPQYQPEKFSDNIYKYRINHAIAGPADWKSFLNNKKVLKRKYLFLKTLISGSDKIGEDKEKINELLNKCGCKEKILEGYGMTEVGAGAVMNLPHINMSESVGIPLKNEVVSIFDSETGQELKYNETGEICISGDTLMRGYYNNPIETSNAMRKHDDGTVWLHTGDLGYMDDDGCLYLVGRMKRIIVRYDGIKVSPYSLEKVILESGMVKECCVVGVPDIERGYGQVPIAYVVLKNKSTDTIGKIREICEVQLSEKYRPKEYREISSLPLTGNGKVDYMKLSR